MMRQAPSNRFRPETRLEAFARQWPSSGVFGRARRLLKPIFEIALGIWGGGGVVSRFPGGEKVRVRPAWRNLSWNPDEYEAFRQATRAGDVVIEAGANAGGYAVLFAQWVGPHGRVYAFEPEPRAFAALTDHIALNGFADRVVAIQAAVSAEPGVVPLRLACSSGLSRIAESVAANSDVVDVTAYSIDDFCARRNIRPAVIKIDVEGGELSVLRGARNTIATAGPDLRLYVEMHPSMWRESGISVLDIVRECEASGLGLERLDGARDGLWDLEGICLRLRPRAGAQGAA